MSTNYMFELQMPNLANDQWTISYWRQQHIYTGGHISFMLRRIVLNTYLGLATVVNLARPTEYVLSTFELYRLIRLTKYLAQMR